MGWAFEGRDGEGRGRGDANGPGPNTEETSNRSGTDMLTNKCFLACVVSVVSNMQTTNRLPAVVEHITGVGLLTPNVRSRCLLVLKKKPFPKTVQIIQPQLALFAQLSRATPVSPMGPPIGFPGGEAARTFQIMPDAAV